MESECCIINKLKIRNFQCLTFTEKENVVKVGPPKHSLHITTNTKKCLRHFNDKVYETESWLCGCRTLNKLFCWSCLLFSKERSVWTTTGYDDLNNVYKAVKRHKYSFNHIICEKELKMFGKNRRTESDEHRRSIDQHNMEVRKNRMILSHFIRAVCFLGKQGLAFGGPTESAESSNRGNFIEYINELTKYDMSFKEHLIKFTVFCATSPDIQNDLISSISAVMTSKIRKEISEASFVSLILDETSDVGQRSQLSTTFRYVTTEGTVEERFIGFTDVTADRKAESLLKHALRILNDFSCLDRLIAQTYDGAAVMAGEHTGLQTEIREHCKSALFVHCYAHQLNLVLLQSASSCIKEVKRFFVSLTAFSTFFAKSVKRAHALDVTVKKRIPSMSQNHWNFKSKLVTTVKELKTDLDDLLESMSNNDNFEWDQDTSMCAGGLLNKLRDFDFNFLLVVFSNIFQQTDVFQVIQKKLTDIAYCNKILNRFQNFLQSYTNEFDPVWEEVTNNTNEIQHQLAKRVRLDAITCEDKKSIYRHLFCEIIDNIRQCIAERFAEITKLSFISLLDSSQFSNFKRKFPEEVFCNLKDNYGSYFDLLGLRSELCVVYTDIEMKKNSIVELYQYIKTMDLTSVFPQTFKLAALIMTIPAMSCSAERSFSSLKRIKSYLRSTQHQERLSSLAMMNIESKLLQDLRSQPSFEDDVIDVFAEKSRGIQLNYRK